MRIEYNKIMEIRKEGARFFVTPGVIRGSKSLLLTREQLQHVFDLTDKEALGFSELVGLGYRSSNPEVAVGGKTMPVSEVKDRLRNLHETPIG